MRIFVVDDEPTIVEALKEMFENSGMEIVGWAYDGDEAIRKYAAVSPPPDVVIMDYRLPTIDGINVMVNILRLEPSARVLFVSADMAARKKAVAAGASGFILKPFKMRDLLASVRGLAQGEGAGRTSPPT